MSLLYGGSTRSIPLERRSLQCQRAKSVSESLGNPQDPFDGFRRLDVTTCPQRRGVTAQLCRPIRRIEEEDEHACDGEVLVITGGVLEERETVDSLRELSPRIESVIRLSAHR